jgi:hypothetical protein
MGSSSTGYVLTELGQVQVLNGVLDNENVGEFSSDDDSVFDSDYTQLVTPSTHPCHQKEGKTSKNMGKGDNLFISAVNMKQGCV